MALIAECWNRAERAVEDAVRILPAPTEEDITLLLALELRKVVDVASDSGRFSRALLSDVRTIIGHDFAAARSLGGLIARVDFHDRSHEGRTSAADMGIMIAQPVLSLTSSVTSHIEICFEDARALLVQAKLAHSKRSRFYWGALTKTQMRRIPRRRDYFSFLLYRIRSQAVDVLDSFSWQLCGGHTLKDMRAWLATDAFPSEKETSEIIRRLADGSIGIADPETIRRLVAPAANRRFITFRVYWPDDVRPSGPVRLRAKSQSQTLLIRRHRG